MDASFLFYLQLRIDQYYFDEVYFIIGMEIDSIFFWNCAID
jgi:hypothetical protein